MRIAPDRRAAFHAAIAALRPSAVAALEELIAARWIVFQRCPAETPPETRDHCLDQVALLCGTVFEGSVPEDVAQPVFELFRNEAAGIPNFCETLPALDAPKGMLAIRDRLQRLLAVPVPEERLAAWCAWHAEQILRHWLNELLHAGRYRGGRLALNELMRPVPLAGAAPEEDFTQASWKGNYSWPREIRPKAPEQGFSLMPDDVRDVLRRLRAKAASGAPLPGPALAFLEAEGVTVLAGMP